MNPFIFLSFSHRKNFNLYDKTLSSETAITDRMLETYFGNAPKFMPITTFKAW
jgi:hypothetical protein